MEETSGRRDVHLLAGRASFRISSRLSSHICHPVTLPGLDRRVYKGGGTSPKCRYHHLGLASLKPGRTLSPGTGWQVIAGPAAKRWDAEPCENLGRDFQPSHPTGWAAATLLG